jgi:cytochrome c2
MEQSPYLILLCLGTPLVLFLIAVGAILLANTATSFSKTRQTLGSAGTYTDQYDSRLIQSMRANDALAQAKTLAAVALRPIYAGDQRLFVWFALICVISILGLIMYAPGAKNPLVIFLMLSVTIGAGVTYAVHRYSGLVDFDPPNGPGVTQPRQATSVDMFLFSFFAASFVVIVIAGWIAAPPPRRGRSVEVSQQEIGRISLVPKSTPAATSGSAGGSTSPAEVKGSPAKGKELFNSQACNACHSIAKDQKLVGPSMYGIWNTAATRKPGLSAKDYLQESILNPSAFVVDTYPAGVMPATYAQSLSAQQIADLLAYFENDLSQK